MNATKIKCTLCGKIFVRPTGQVNEARKFGWNQFCSTQCMAESKMTGTELSCANGTCTKKFYRPPKEIKKVQRSFCSYTCAAIINNKLRAANRPKKYCAYQNCQRIIPQDQKYCSRFHSALTRRISSDVFRKRFKKKIESFYQKCGRIPVKREMYGVYREARKSFGSWNNAITAAGFIPNPVLFAKRQKACDGHECDSFAEKIIDDWLYKKHIPHKRSIRYPNSQKLTADFVTKNQWIEFFGLAGEVKEYDRSVQKKKRLAKKHGLPLIALYPRDLFPIRRLSKLLLK